MRRRLAAAFVNGALLAMAALTVFPLVWMLSVSLMSPGEASTFPPPLLPGRATLANYRELFTQAGMGGYLVNSVALTTAVTLGSLLFNVAAGYAFAESVGETEAGRWFAECFRDERSRAFRLRAELAPTANRSARR